MLRHSSLLAAEWEFKKSVGKNRRGGDEPSPVFGATRGEKKNNNLSSSAARAQLKTAADNN